MSILKDYEELRNELGDMEFELMEDYINKTTNGTLLSDLLYNQKENDKFQEWKKLNIIINKLPSNFEPKVYNNDLLLLAIGKRNDVDVALVYMEVKGYPKYNQCAVVIDYKIEDNDLNWSYGYYYDTDFSKALEDFEKVKNGESLSETFNKNVIGVDTKEKNKTDIDER